MLQLLAFLASLLFATTTATPYDALKREAEKFVEEKSYAHAHQLYEQADKLTLSAAERRWVDFRLADTAWRMDESNRDTTALVAIVNGAEHDRVWAEANESLGDLTSGNNYYLAALDWWAGSDDIDYARKRYLSIFRRLATENRYGYRNQIPREVLVNVVSIANDTNDAMHARFLLAQQLLGEGRPDSMERAGELLAEIIAAGKKSEWYDDALYTAAMYASSVGHIIVNGEPDPHASFTRALELYRRLVSEFAKGESKYRDDAERAIQDILAPSVNLAAAGTFLPDSEQEVNVSWRNTKRVELAIYALDLMTFQEKKNVHWMNTLRWDPKPLRKWTYETSDSGDHVPGYHNERITPRLERGAYWMTASADGKSASLLLMVTDTHILLQSSPTLLQIFVSDVLRGEPIAGARVRVGQRWGSDESRVDEVTTNADGIAVVQKVNDNPEVVIAASAGKGKQAWHATYAYGYRSSTEGWKIYAFTDRPAYRPGETVQWKVIARTRENDLFSTPAGQKIGWEIRSPRDEKIAAGDATLNAYGSFSASLPLTESMPLGEYRVTFKVGGSDSDIGYATLFRLEEYKLPEFRVSVSTPDKKLYRLGDRIEATIEASYYFGGPVANATVEAVIYQQPLYRYWFPWRKYPWYYDDYSDFARGGPMLRRETLKTDANGRAVVSIDTPRDGSDTRYRIEARVVDASRREVRGEGSVAVTKQRYTVMAQPEHYIHRPGDPVEVLFKAVDANDQPVQATGTVKVIKRAWIEKDRSYADEEVLSSNVATNAKGEASFMFTPRREGYYTVRWSSEDRDPDRPLRARDIVTAETMVWVADRATTDLSYFTSGLQLIVDKETLRAGETASVMVVAPASGRWVVVNATGDDILDTRVVHLDGTVKLVQMTVDARHEPSFTVNAASVFDRAIAVDNKIIVVPPAEQFIDVAVKSDREEYQPRDEGTVTITTRDVDGKPVAAEVALAVSDEAVTAIQQDLAGDPREFFYGNERSATLQVTGSAQTQQYVRLVENKNKVLIDDRLKDREDAASQKQSGYVDMDRFEVSGVVGGVLGGARDMAAPAPAPAPPPMSEAVTVTAQAPAVDAQRSAMAAMKKEQTSVEVEVRSDFRTTAFWKSDIVTDANGVARVAFKFPEGLTTWRATARAATTAAQFGIGTSTSRTNMPLIVRLQAPRFFVAGDHSTVSAVINNNTDEAMRVEPKLEVEGLTLNMTTNAPINVPAHGEARADWSVVADRPGNAKLRVSGRGAKFGDAMEKSFVVYEHGIDKLIARSGKLRGDEALITLALPRERRATDLVVQVAPSLAVTMIDALPYLVDYPYGCTEQTMSRFLPAAIVAKTLSQMGLDAKKRIPRLDEVTKASIARLYDFQHPDGGWGWWKEDPGSTYMTAYVVWGFSIARDAGMDVDTERVERAFTWLNEHLKENEDDWETDAWIVHAMSAWNHRPSKNSQDAFDDAWEHRERLTSYSRALLALTAHRYGAKEREAVLVRNLENGVKIDRTPDQSVLVHGGSSTAETMATAHWGQDRFWWRWHDGPIESTAFVLQALVASDPKHKLVEPAMNWLVKNRRGAQWTNTRDTAITVLALNDYLRASGETVRDVTYDVTVNGKSIATKTVTAKQLLDAPSRFSVDPSILRDTDQEIRIRANAPVYFSAEARFVSLEEPVKAAGNELFVKREYFRLAPKPTLLKGVVYDRIPLGDGGAVISGERIEVVDTIETKNDYEYLLFEDLKPAGFEAVELQSGQSLYATNKDGVSQWIYQELRDRKVAMFADRLTQGTWTIRYTLRAETPGEFHALPLLGHAMYVPDIRANGDETRVVVKDQ